MANKYARKNFYDVVTINDVQQLNYLSLQWIRFRSFIKNKNVTTFRVNNKFEWNLPRIAHEFYGNVHLWWIIAISNPILNPIEDVVIGTVLLIPNLTDIEDFYQNVLGRRQQLGEITIPKIVV